jgi:hypothetical protein
VVLARFLAAVAVGALPARRNRASADVEVVLAVVAVVADVEDLVVGQPADGPIGVGLVRDVHPQRSAAVAGVAEVQLDGGRVVASSRWLIVKACG